MDATISGGGGGMNNRTGDTFLRSVTRLQLGVEESFVFRRQQQVTESMVTRLAKSAELEGHAGCVNCLEWSEDGRLLASGSDDQTVILARLPPVLTDHNSHMAAIQCIVALLNSTVGKNAVLCEPHCLERVAAALSCLNPRTQQLAAELLAAVCLTPTGHKTVLQTLTALSSTRRFQSLIWCLQLSSGPYATSTCLKTAVLSLINALLSCGAGENSIEFRIHLRTELFAAGLGEALDGLRLINYEGVAKHVDIFDSQLQSDETEWATKCSSSTISTTTRKLEDLTNGMRQRLQLTPAYDHFISLLQHLALLPPGSHFINNYWRFIDLFVQQMVLQKPDGTNPDKSLLDSNLSKVIRQLADDSQLKQLQQKLRDTQRENDDFIAKVFKAEHEAEIRSEEKAQLQSALNKMVSRLERQEIGMTELKQQVTQQRSSNFSLLRQFSSDREKLISALLSANVTIPRLEARDISPDLVSDLPPVPPVPPPIMGPDVGDVPPMSIPPPPPPPPPVLTPPNSPIDIMKRVQMNGHAVAVKKRNIPRPSQPMKSFNWTKLNEMNIKGTVWENVEDDRVYPKLDLQEFDTLFSAYQRRLEDNTATLRSRGNSELSLVSSRRAQNCTILLSKLKMSNAEIAAAILAMDVKDEIPKDLAGELLKYIPTKDEVAILKEHEKEADNFSRGDRFLYDVSRIPHYEAKVRALLFKKRFRERLEDLSVKTAAVMEACEQLSNCKNFLKLLEVVLAFGNYVNNGARGNARGFRLSSLVKLSDTKSSSNTRLTLLHYLITVLERSFPAVLFIDSELHSIKEAAKVDMSELETELAQLKVGLREIERELEWHEVNGISETSGDRFVSEMRDFHTLAFYQFSELEEAVDAMRKSYKTAIKQFAEEASKCRPSEFYGTLATFFQLFQESWQELKRIRQLEEQRQKRKEVEERLKQQLTLGRRTALTRTSNSSSSRLNSDDSGEFDSLVSALRSGEIFETRRGRRRKPRGRSESRERPVQKLYLNGADGSFTAA